VEAWVKANVELGTDQGRSTIQHERYTSSVLWGSSQVDSNVCPALPFMEDAGSSLYFGVQDVNRTAKRFPVFWIYLYVRLRKYLLRCPLHFVLHVWSSI
jgi:hypothetical protein